jgi:hypothetical protein
MTIEQNSNQFLIPLTKPQEGRTLRNPVLLWKKRGRLLIAERIRLTTDRVFSIWCQNNVLSNTWWTLRVNPILHKKFSDIDAEKTISVWLNSTLGAIQFLRVRTETEGPWISYKKPNLNSMKILNPHSLSQVQIQRFVGLFDLIKREHLAPLPELLNDKIRQTIDSEISKILKIPDIGNLRELLSREPIFSSVHNETE